MKISLERKKENPWAYRNPRSNHSTITQCLPFYLSRMGRYVHRIRSGTVYRWDGKFSHAGFFMWCGQNGSSTRGSLMATLPEDAIMCATCEGRAVGAGLLGVREINGVPVEFSPRK